MFLFLKNEQKQSDCKWMPAVPPGGSSLDLRFPGGSYLCDGVVVLA